VKAVRLLARALRSFANLFRRTPAAVPTTPTVPVVRVPAPVVARPDLREYSATSVSPRVRVLASGRRMRRTSGAGR
jgi:hypothetical protein